jgi:anaerobic dimethyl sulfoxide reductase subunit B (iron-sulfur subunit)
MRTYDWEEGTWPDTRLHFLAIPCYHCDNPVCVPSCPFGAIYKESKYGAVLVDQERCVPNCKICWTACPYGSPQFDLDNMGETKMSMCNMCIDRLDDNKLPACVTTCPARALDFGPIDDLKAKYGDLQQLPQMPSPSITNPSVVFKPAQPRKQLIPYDKWKALELWKWRWNEEDEYSLPRIFEDVSDVTEVPEGLVKRNKLVLKPQTHEELIYYTSDSGE